MTHTEYSNPKFGLKVQMEQHEKSTCIKWSGESTWHPKKDSEDGLYSFLAVHYDNLDSLSEVDVHIEELASFSSRTMHVIIRLLGQTVAAGCSVRLHYTPTESAEWIVGRVEEAVEGPMSSLLELVAVAGKEAS